jgi:hypothetical protein
VTHLIARVAWKISRQGNDALNEDHRRGDDKLDADILRERIASSTTRSMRTFFARNRAFTLI